MRKMRRYRRLIRIYAIAAVLALALYAGAESLSLTRWRQMAAYSSSLAFEETVRAVDSLSQALDKSLFATDGAMCARVCSEAYASACAAESAMATLPFSTQELERLSAFLNRAGDYAYTLCRESAESGFSAGQREDLRQLSARADEFTGTLRQLREDLNGGSVHMDSREFTLRNVGMEPGEALSARLLAYESAFSAPEELRYDGQFGREERSAGGYLTEHEMLLAAAGFLGVEAEELEPLYSYEGTEGRRCFRCGDSFLCVSRSGVDSLSQVRLVSEAVLTLEEAQSAAENFLARAGYGDLSLKELSSNGTVVSLRYARTEDGAVWVDNDLSIAIALDDGSVYSFNADGFDRAESGVRWEIDEETAALALPDEFVPAASRRLILTSPGGYKHGCYEFSGEAGGGRTVRICVVGTDGRQCRITLD